MSCCPEGSFGYLRPDTAVTGTLVEGSIEGIDFYKSGSCVDGTAVVCIPDVWGYNSGRTRLLADHFSTELNCVSVVPKLQVCYRPLPIQSNSHCGQDINSHLLPPFVLHSIYLASF